jgi:hypothetical protein
MIQEWIGQQVVVDLSSPYVCLGLLSAADEVFIELQDADIHDLRDTRTTRENYIVASLTTGIKRNRKTVRIARAEIVAIARLKDVVVE